MSNFILKYTRSLVFTPQPMAARGIVMSMTDGRAGRWAGGGRRADNFVPLIAQLLDYKIFKSLASIADIIYLCMVMLI